MKKLKLTAVCFLFIVMLTVPCVSHAAVLIDDPPAPPQVLRAYKTASRKVTLKWRGQLGVSGYEIYLKKGNGKYHKIKEIKSRKVRKYTVKNLSPRGVYRLRMRSYKNLEGERKYSRYMMLTVDMKKPVNTKWKAGR